MKKILVGALVCLVGLASKAQFNELDGWFNVGGDAQNPIVLEGSGSPKRDGGGSGNGGILAEATTPEIEALALGLENDPQRIFDYVHDHIRYLHYFGSKKGAHLTLLEGSGNDFDQCALLMALLRAAGYTNATYKFGVQLVAYETSDHRDYVHWLGLSKPNTNWSQASGLAGYINWYRGYPIALTDPTDTNHLAFHRLWVKLPLSGTNYVLDPAFKISEPITNIDLHTASGMDSNALWTAAGGTVTADSAQSLTETTLRNKLRDYTTNLLAYLGSNYPNSSVEQVAGGRQITPTAGQPFGTQETWPVFTWDNTWPVEEWQNIPTNWIAQLTVTFGNSNKTFYVPELQGKRLSLIFTNGQSQLWLDDDQVLSRANVLTNGQVNVTLNFDHPHRQWNYFNNSWSDTNRNDMTKSALYRTNGTYALLYSFETSPSSLRKRQEKLDTYRQQGLADNSREVVSETLNVMGLDWMLQTELFARLLAAQTGTLHQYHHLLGRMAQEPSWGYYVDVYAQLSGLMPGNGDAGQVYKAFDLRSYFASAMEHGVIEQLQVSNLVAASTTKMVQVANDTGLKIYLTSTNQNNWTSGANVRSHLSGYDLGYLDGLVYGGHQLLLPESGQVQLSGSNSWRGYGIVDRISTPTFVNLAMLIQGGYNGGYSAFPNVTVDPGYVWNWNYSVPTYFSSQPVSLPTFSGGDPVDMSDASFRVTSADLSLDQPEPRGIALTRYYSPTRRHHNLAGLAPGWTHNYFLNVAEVSAPQSSLGLTTPAQMAPMLVALRAATEFHSISGGPKDWAVTALIAKWGVDQMRSNAVSTIMGDNTVQFVKQPDGTYTPPAKSTMTLLKTNSVFWLQERQGNTFKFDGLGRLTNIVDQYQQPLTISYLSSTSSLPLKVTDWKTNTLTFTYTSNRITSVADSTGRSVSYGYSASGDLVSVTDPENKTSRFLYDTNHQVIASSNALSQLVVSNLYDAFGRVTTQYTQGDPNKLWRICWSDWETVEQDPAGGKRRFSYDDKHRLIAFRDALSNVSQTFYDGQDHIVTTISPLNETNRFEFDGRHNVIRSIDALNFTNNLFYDAQDNLIRTVDARGNTNRFGYNSKFQLTATTNGTGDWVTFAYNGTDGTLTNRTDAGGTTGYSYDGKGLLNVITYPGSLGSEGFLNSATSDVLSHTNARGFVTSFQYNNRRELTNTIAPTNVTAKVTFDADGNVSSKTNPRGFTTSNTWSATRKLLAWTLSGTPQGVPATTNTYDSRDWLVRTTENPASSISATTVFTNDAAQRLISVTDPLLRTTRFGYDNVGRKIAATNAVQEVTRLEWNKRRELTNLIDAAAHTVKRGYDGSGNQTALTNRNSKPWQFYFDAANRLTNTITPVGRETRIVYDARGLVSTVREPSTQTTTNFYDAAGRLTNTADSISSVLRRYDANNNVTNVIENGKTNTWTYDAYDHVSSYKDTDGNQIQYRYDADGNLTDLIYPGNRTVTYAYDSLNRLTNVTDWANRKTSFEYDLASRLTRIIRPNGSVREMNYDAARQTTNIVERLTNNAPIALFRFVWNSNSTVQWEFAAPKPQAFTPPTRTMEFDDDNRLKKINSSWVTNDTDGNLTYAPLTNSTPFTNYAYDVRNRLLNVGGVDYGYDPTGNRSSLTNGGTATRFVINPNASLSQILMRIKSGTTNYYIHGLGLLYEITETATSTNTATYHYDYRGSTIAITDGTGTPTDRIEYSPYGTTMYRAGTNDTPFLYSGRYGVQTDPNGLLYMRARYYNPYLCRFISADPTGFSAGLNFYAYADGNPVSMIDPFGLGADRLTGSGSWLENAYSSIGNALLGPVDYGDGSISFDPSSFASGADSLFNAMQQEQLRTDVGRTVVMTAVALIPIDRPVMALLGTGERALGTVAAKSEVTALTKFYPENAGFAGATERTFLMPGQTIDRYGGSGVSRFFSPQGTADWARSLPPGTTGQPLRTFEVVKPFEVQSGTVAPWFNQPGGGLQYRSPVQLEILLKRGIIKEVTP